MLKRILLPSILLLLGYGFWLSPDFKEIAAGVSIFLFGMLALEEGFRAFTGGFLERILQRCTNRLWKSFSLGVFVTGLMQSSSLISVITISFLSAGLLDLAAGIGIIFGANLGTTSGAWLIAGLGLKVNISSYAMPILVFGVIFVLQKNKYIQGLGYVLAGIGFLFLGLHYMKQGFEAFRTVVDLSAWSVAGFPGLILYVCIGALATVVMQSSHATLVLIITALAAGQVSYENSLALAIGANIGTTITAVIGAMSANEQGKRLAFAHLIFNGATAALAVLFIYQLVWLVDVCSSLLGIGLTNYTLRLALFHTLFNLLGIIVMVPLIPVLVKYLPVLIKGKEHKICEAKYLLSSSAEFPDTAVEAVRNETLHVYEKALPIIINGICLRTDSVASQASLHTLVSTSTKVIAIDVDASYQRNVKGLFGDIVTFISQIPFSWELKQSSMLYWMRNANQHLVEAIKATKHLRTNLCKAIGSSHPEVRNIYNRMRIIIMSVLRELELAHQNNAEHSALLAIDALKLMVSEGESELHLELTELLRTGKLNGHYVTSMMNDSAYTFVICNNLIAFAETMFVGKDRQQLQLEREVVLNEQELDNVASAGSNE